MALNPAGIALPAGWAAPRDALAVRPEGPLRSLRDLTRALTILLPIAALAGLVSGYASLRRAALIDNVLAGGAHDQAKADAADNFVRIADFAHVVASIPIMVLFILWFWWLAGNSARLDRAAAPHDGWAIGSWLLPVANLWLPAAKLIRADRLSGAVVDRNTSASRRLIIMWATALGLAVTGIVAQWLTVPNVLLTVQDVEVYSRADRYDLVVQIVLAFAALLAVIMVRRLTVRQELAFADRAALARDELQRQAADLPPLG